MSFLRKQESRHCSALSEFRFRFASVGMALLIVKLIKRSWLLTRIYGSIGRFSEHNRLKIHLFSVEFRPLGFPSDCRRAPREACDLSSSIPGLRGW